MFVVDHFSHLGFFNRCDCPIVHVKEIVGHERLDTTCKYYLGVDKELAKKAHGQYLHL
jgi:hypothetical protein